MVTYPSQIFLTLFFSWSPWKKMMKTDLWTWSLCGNITQLVTVMNHLANFTGNQFIKLHSL